LTPGDADGFVAVLSKIVDDTFTNDYWEIRLPNDLDSSASKSPALLAYIAALNILDADALLSTGKVRARLDPAVTAKKGIERHHLFPRAYLRQLGIHNTKRVNQIANMALVEWFDNISISDEPPMSYWPDQIRKKKLSRATLEQQLRWHALPKNWTSLPYDTFLSVRRKLMSEVVRAAFKQLADPDYTPVYPPAGQPTENPVPTRTRYRVSVGDLLDAGLLSPGAVLINQTDDAEAVVLDDGRIEFDGLWYESPTGAAEAARGAPVNGWSYWLADTKNGLQTLRALRDELLKSEDEAAE
jgi:hypothetical protein